MLSELCTRGIVITMTAETTTATYLGTVRKRTHLQTTPWMREDNHRDLWHLMTAEQMLAMGAEEEDPSARKLRREVEEDWNSFETKWVCSDEVDDGVAISPKPHTVDVSEIPDAWLDLLPARYMSLTMSMWAHMSQMIKKISDVFPHASVSIDSKSKDFIFQYDVCTDAIRPKIEEHLRPHLKRRHARFHARKIGARTVRHATAFLASGNVPAREERYLWSEVDRRSELFRTWMRDHVLLDCDAPSLCRPEARLGEWTDEEGLTSMALQFIVHL